MNKKQVLTSDDRATYRAILEGVAAIPGLGVIANRFPWQSRMAIEKLLDFALQHKLRVSILSGGGPEGFYDESLAKKLRECKSAGCQPIRILIWQKDTADISPALMGLSEAGAIDLRISGTDEFADRIPHFVLVGDQAFRQEAAHRRFAKETVFTETDPQIPARIDFHDKETGERLQKTFDRLWEGQ
jgi:hypothetical protein